MDGELSPSILRVSGQGSFSMQKGITGRERSHKEGHKPNQQMTNEAVPLIDNSMGNAGVFLSVRLSDGRPCPMR